MVQVKRHDYYTRIEEYTMKRLGKLTAVILIVASVVLPATTVHAQSVEDIIICGLASGINFTFGSACTNDNDGNNGSSTPTPKPPAPTPQPPISTPAPRTSNTYAALGDSVAAGLGLATPTTSGTAAAACGRTAEAYPNIVAQNMNLPLVHAACSGATMGDMFTEQDINGTDIPPQFNAAFAGGTPQLITMTAGANDAHWVQFIQTCYFGNCATATETTLADGLLFSLRAKMVVMFTDLQARSHGHPPTTVVTGYYNPLSSACTSLTPNITSDEITWMSAEVNALNTTLQRVVSNYSFAKFAPVDFSGHDICSSAPWVQGVSGNAPFHPTATGQQVIAQSVLRTLGR